jgi:hypothetical protein
MIGIAQLVKGVSKMKELTHIEAIRLLSGMFNPDHAINILSFINLIARNYLGDATDSFTDEQLTRIKIKLKREKEIE